VQFLEKRSIVHPLLFALVPVIFLFSNNIHEVTFIDFLLPSLIILFSVFLIWVFFSIISKNKIKSALALSLSIFLFFSYGHIFNFLNSSIEYGLDPSHHKYLLGLLFLPFLIGVIYLIKTNRKFDNLTIIVNVIAIALISISAINIGTFYFEQNNIQNNIQSNNNENFEKSSLNSITTEELPDVYYIILDSYPRADILTKYFNYDNSPFINFLEEKGFFVTTESHTNYPQSYLSIASSLNMEYMDYFTDEVGENSRDRRPVYDSIKYSEVAKKFKSHGYSFINFNSGMTMTSDIPTADRNLCGNNRFLINEFTIQLIGMTALKPFYVYLLNDLSDVILCTFSTLPEVKENTSEPIFVLAHIMIPHPPFIFGPNGESISPDSLDLGQATYWFDKESAINQITFTNKQTQELISKIFSHSKNSSIIIIQSDHGTASLYPAACGNDLVCPIDNLTDEYIIERMSNFGAYYLPSNDYNLFYDSMTPVNIFRIIFNSYFDDEYPILEDKMYWSVTTAPYQFVEMTDKLGTDFKN